ncbi:MAG: glycerophosphodiester phosphodiesterase [Legionella longbeachae]|nr:glycerophosphodiester phosphodiesterase [Legionella longbeachae]
MLLTMLDKTLQSYFAIIPRNEPSFEMIQSTRLIAHRGVHNYNQGIIENTFSAFDLAKKLGCWGIEFDVRATADKVLVVNHDATLKRLWGYPQTIANLTFGELRALVPQIPSLNEVIDAYGNSMHLFIELKTPFQDEGSLVNALQKLSAGQNYHLLTLNDEIFRSLSHFPKNALLLVAAHNNVQEFCNICFKENYAGVLGHYFMITNKIINRLKEANKIVGVGQVNSKYSLYRELNRGIPLLFTDQAAAMQFYIKNLH